LRSLIFSLTPSGSQHFITLNPYLWCQYNFLFRRFLFTPTFSGTQLGRKTRCWCTILYNSRSSDTGHNIRSSCSHSPLEERADVGVLQLAYWLHVFETNSSQPYIIYVLFLVCIMCGKGKGHPVTFHWASALEGGGCRAPCPGRFIPGKETRYPLHRRQCGPQGQDERVRKTRLYRGSNPEPYMFILEKKKEKRKWRNMNCVNS
jgi:hypothetical protein